MTASGFDIAYPRVRVYEGGDVDHPRDPGGRTSRGVTQRVYDGFRIGQKLPTRDVFLATEEEIKTIYRAQYWDAVRGDELPAGVDLVVFDGAIHSGPAQSIKWLQRALGVERVDGVIGAVTKQAVRGVNDHDLLIERISERRMGFLRSLKTWKHFGRGWSARVANVTKAGQALAIGSIGPAPVSVAEYGGNERAEGPDVTASVDTANVGNTATGVGMALATANEAVREIAPQAQALITVSDTFRVIFIAVTVIGFAITAYTIFRSRKQQRAVTAADTAPVEWDADEAIA